MPRYLVLDWDHQQLQLVAATVKGTAVRLEQAVAVDVPHSPNPAQAQELGHTLRDRLKAAGITPAPVVVAVGRDRVIFKDIRHPPVPPSEEAAIVRFQAVKELNDPANEVVIDYVSRPATGADRRALAVVLRRELLSTYQQLCLAAGLKLAGICPRPFGAAGCVRHAGATDTVGVLTAADKWAEFCVVRGDHVLLARTLALPGSDEALLGEIRRNLAVFAGQAPQEPVRALYIADGTPRGNLRDRLCDRLAIPVHALDPLGELPAPPERRGGFAGAVGLLHVLAQQGALPINFNQPRDVKPTTDPNRRKAVLAASLIGALLLAGVVMGWTTLAAKDRRLAELMLQKTALDTQLVQSRDDDKRIKAIGEWVGTEVVWLDELYDLADRVPDVTAMRITGLTAVPRRTTAGDKHVASITVNGISNDNYDMVDGLIRQFVRDGAYRVAPKKMSRNNTGIDRVFSQQFSVQMDVEPRPAAKYTRQLTALPPPPPPAPPKPKPANPLDGVFDLGNIPGGGRP